MLSGRQRCFLGGDALWEQQMLSGGRRCSLGSRDLLWGHGCSLGAEISSGDTEKSPKSPLITDKSPRYLRPQTPKTNLCLQRVFASLIWEQEMLSGGRRCFLGSRELLWRHGCSLGAETSSGSRRSLLGAGAALWEAEMLSRRRCSLGAGAALWEEEMLSGKQSSPLAAWMLSRSRDLPWEQEIASGSRRGSLGGRDAL